MLRTGTKGPPGYLTEPSSSSSRSTSSRCPNFPPPPRAAHHRRALVPTVAPSSPGSALVPTVAPSSPASRPRRPHCRALVPRERRRRRPHLSSPARAEDRTGHRRAELFFSGRSSSIFFSGTDVPTPSSSSPAKLFSGTNVPAPSSSFAYCSSNCIPFPTEVVQWHMSKQLSICLMACRSN